MLEASGDKADGPDAVATWDLRNGDGEYLGLSGYDDQGARIVYFTVRKTSIFDGAGDFLGEGLALQAIEPEVGTLEINPDGTVRTATLTPRMLGFLAQFRGDVEGSGSGGKADESDGQGPSACKSAIFDSFLTVSSYMLCVGGVTPLCFIAGAQTVLTAIDLFDCLTDL